MKSVRAAVVVVVVLLVLTAVASEFLQPGALDVARARCAEQGWPADRLAVAKYARTGTVLFGDDATVEFLVRGTDPPKRLRVTLRRPAFLLGWQVEDCQEQAAEALAPRGEAITDPVLRDARAQADSTLDGLLAGQFDADADLGPVARKVKGYQSYSVTGQTIVRDGAAEFRGVLTGPPGRARFTLTLVTQPGGQWAVGAFSGPNPE